MRLHKVDSMYLDLDYLTNHLKQMIDEDCEDGNEIAKYIKEGV